MSISDSRANVRTVRSGIPRSCAVFVPRAIAFYPGQSLQVLSLADGQLFHSLPSILCRMAGFTSFDRMATVSSVTGLDCYSSLNASWRASSGGISSFQRRCDFIPND